MGELLLVEAMGLYDGTIVSFLKRSFPAAADISLVSEEAIVFMHGDARSYLECCEEGEGFKEVRQGRRRVQGEMVSE